MILGERNFSGIGLTWSGLKNPMSALDLSPDFEKSGKIARSGGTTRRVAGTDSGSAGAEKDKGADSAWGASGS